jgi:hypothetical protein
LPWWERTREVYEKNAASASMDPADDSA